MARPSTRALGFSAVAGLANVATVAWLYTRFDYPLLESPGSTAVFAVTAFVVGFVPTVFTIHTRALSPVFVFLGALTGGVVLEVTSPPPEWGELGGYTVVDGPIYILNYASAWYLWLALALFAGTVEFGLRRGYRLGGDRLRNLPELPLSRGALTRIVGGVAALFGFAVFLLTLRQGPSPRIAAVAILLGAIAVAAIPLAALLWRGIVSSLVLFSLWVPYILLVDVFRTTESPVHLLLLGPYALVLVIVWALEEVLRRRVGGWDGGRFTADGEPTLE